MNYSAFISYSSKDVASARWLHRALESYRLPAAGKLDHPALREDGRRLKPVFRDRDELSAAHDLGASIRKALAQCETLIVLCSPASAQSKWVDAEVQEYQRLGRAERIFCLLVEGQPDGSIEGCFPPSLIGADGSEPLAADLRKHMDGRTVAKLKLLAGILQVDYDRLRQREQSRRHRQLALVAAASLAGLVVTSGLAVAAYLARNEAIEQRNVARVRTATAEQTVAFVTGMFQVADPSEARGSTITAREILDGARKRYRTALRNQPVVQSQIALTLSEVYGALGLFDESGEIAASIPDAGLRDPQVAMRTRIVRGELLLHRGQWAPAAKEFTAALNTKSSVEEGNPALVSRAYNGLGQALSAVDEFDRSDRALNGALAIDKSRGDEGRRDVARDLEALGLNEMYAGDLAVAEKFTRQANAIRLSLEGKNSPSVSDNINTLANIAYFQGDRAKAEKLFRSRLAIDERVLGRDHPDVAITLNNIARTLLERRAFGKAAPLLERAIDITRRKRGDSFDDLAFMLSSLGIAERERGQTAEAEKQLRDSVAVAQDQKHRALAPNMVELAALLCGDRRVTEGQAMLDQAAPIMAKAYPDEAWRMAWLDLARAKCWLAEGDAESARRLVKQARPTIAADWPKGTYYRHEADRLATVAGA